MAAEKKATHRGSKSQNVRCDPNLPDSNYACIRPCVIQGGRRGIKPFNAALNTVPPDSQDLVLKFVRSIEHFFMMFIDGNEIQIYSPLSTGQSQT
jgi:hypothetical protein